MLKPILVFGFPHCGTSILKTLIGSCEGVYYTQFESMHPPEKVPSEFDSFVIKWPYLETNFLESDYEQYYKIFILRNPLYAYTSINNRFNSENRIVDVDPRHRPERFAATVQAFCQPTNDPKLIKVRYEDLFDNDFAIMKKTLDDIGLTYTNNIFSGNSGYRLGRYVENQVPIARPNSGDHVSYRTWQINQPFCNMNQNDLKVRLTNHQLNVLMSNRHVKQLWNTIHLL